MIKKRGFSERRAERRARKHGEVHAKRGVPSCEEDVVVKIIGKEPEIDPDNDPLLAQWYADKVPHQDRDEWDRRLVATKEEITQDSSRWTLRAIFVFLLLTEFAALSNLVANQGIENPGRSIISAAGSLILFYLTKKAVDTAPKEGDDE